MDNNLEKISILIINYNSKFIEECIESVINQTSDRWDLYLVEFADKEQNKSIYDKYRDNSKIKISYLDKNIGYLEAKQDLIKNSENDIVGLLDANDKLHETAIEKVLNKYSKYYKAGFVYTNFWFCDVNINTKKIGFCKHIPNGFTNLDSLFTSNFITFRKSVFDKIDGYNESLIDIENIDLVLKMEEVTRLHFVDEPLYYQRDNGLKYSIIKKVNLRIQRFKSIQSAKEMAYERRELENNDNLFDRIIPPDLNYFKKRRIRKNPTPINKNDGLENLLSAKKIFNKLGIDYWLTDGTLLGYYRENDFIKHDLDLDLGSFIKDYDDKIMEEFLNEGWTIYSTFGKKNIGYEISLIRDNLKLDVFFFYEENDNYWHACWYNSDKRKRMVKYYFEKFDFGEGEFLGHNFSIPKNCESYLIEKYGESWRTPTKNWNYVTSPPNAVQTEVYL